MARLTRAADSWLRSTNAGPQIAAQRGLDFDLLAERRRQQPFGLVNEFVDVDLSGLQRAACGRTPTGLR